MALPPVPDLFVICFSSLQYNAQQAEEGEMVVEWSDRGNASATSTNSAGHGKDCVSRPVYKVTAREVLALGRLQLRTYISNQSNFAKSTLIFVHILNCVSCFSAFLPPEESIIKDLCIFTMCTFFTVPFSNECIF